jgi:hypothetical protein
MEFVPSSITNWILSLKNFKLLWRKLQAVDFKFLLPRSLNQNSLENFFSIIRSHGARNIKPTCTHFKAAFKTLILNNFMAAHSIGANCEEDESEAALCSLRYFIHGELSEDTHVSYTTGLCNTESDTFEPCQWSSHFNVTLLHDWVDDQKNFEVGG